MNAVFRQNFNYKVNIITYNIHGKENNAKVFK